MTTSIVAISVALIVYAYVEVLGRTYPTPTAWRKLRRRRGRRAARRMRERFEEAGSSKTGRRLLTFVLALAIIWVASASLLDKRWYEVVADVAPSLIVILALYRLPEALLAAAERMKDLERQAGEDPDQPLDDDDLEGPEIAL